MIRQAKKQDYEEILHIRKTLLVDYTKVNEHHYRILVEKSGFLMYKKNPTQEEFENDLNKIYLVYEEKGTVKGYLRIDEEQEMSKEINTLWYKPEMEKIYFSVPHANTGGVALLPEVAKKGIGTELLNAAILEIRKKKISYLFAFVAISPMSNLASLLFHERNGFERLAIATVPELFGFRNYQSFLYGKLL